MTPLITLGNNPHEGATGSGTPREKNPDARWVNANTQRWLQPIVKPAMRPFVISITNRFSQALAPEKRERERTEDERKRDKRIWKKQ